MISLTTIPQLYELAIFGSFWVLSILVTVEILHPVMICYLPPPEGSPALPAEVDDPRDATGSAG